MLASDYIKNTIITDPSQSTFRQWINTENKFAEWNFLNVYYRPSGDVSTLYMLLFNANVYMRLFFLFIKILM